MAYGTFPNSAAAHAIELLTRGINNYGNTDVILTDRGFQFYASKGRGKKKGESKFGEFLGCMNIKHIVASTPSH